MGVGAVALVAPAGRPEFGVTFRRAGFQPKFRAIYDCPLIGGCSLLSWPHIGQSPLREAVTSSVGTAVFEIGLMGRIMPHPRALSASNARDFAGKIGQHGGDSICEHLVPFRREASLTVLCCGV